MTIGKEPKNLGMPWEKDYGYSQAVKVGDTIYISGQVSHDDQGNIVGHGNMEAQMRQAYVNLKKVLAQYGATIENVVDEILFGRLAEGGHVVLDEAGGECREQRVPEDGDGHGDAAHAGLSVSSSTTIAIARMVARARADTQVG